jgi:hypothetical protein
MGRKKGSSKNLFTESKKDKIKSCIDCLHENGYGIFKLDGEDVRVEEIIYQLTALGYKVIRFEDDLAKVDVNFIKSAEDIIRYFHEMWRRHEKVDSFKIPKTAAEKRICHSIVNFYIQQRIKEGGLSFKASLEELFKIINVLFEVYKDWGIKIEGMGVISINSNRKLINSLLKEIRLREDINLSYEMDKQIYDKCVAEYGDTIDNSITEMKEVEKPKRGRRKKIKVSKRGKNNAKEKER